jgi:hypothetical protein
VKFQVRHWQQLGSGQRQQRSSGSGFPPFVVYIRQTVANAAVGVTAITFGDHHLFMLNTSTK